MQMPDQPDSNSISGVENPTPEPSQPSIRDIAEAAYDEGSSPNAAEPSSDDRPRDERGRFVPKEQAQDTGEAEPEAPSPVKQPEAQDRPEPAPAGSSTQGMEHWSAEDRATFARAPKDVQDMFQRRYSEMEADYTRKSQANATAVQAVNALAPIFNDPDIQASLREMQFHPIQAIHDWARMHKAAISQDPRVRASTLYEITERMGFDPAKVFAHLRQPDPSVPDSVRNDPAYKFVSDLNSRTNSEVQALRAELHQFRAQETSRVEEEAYRATRWSVDNFADEKGPDGKPVRPYFDRVINTVIDMYKANPERDLQQAYEQACWMDEGVRREMLQAERNRAQHASSNQRAAQAARSNVRGLTSPVSKPAQENRGNGTLHDVIQASADEVGF